MSTRVFLFRRFFLPDFCHEKIHRYCAAINPLVFVCYFPSGLRSE